ncbi:MAG: dihydrolipoyllysine-residue acetyltransferase [Gammaproteobacteria bacterium]|nr:dihydrolipoyllysine-residue acetyltransferase [Gammaproteobacteria bacterium]
MVTMLDVTVPDIGDFEDVLVIEVLVAVGDSIDKDSPLIVLETEKASMEVPSPSAGVIGSIAVKVGERLVRGGAILTLKTEAAKDSTAAPEGAAAALTPQPTVGDRSPSRVAVAMAVAPQPIASVQVTEKPPAPAVVESSPPNFNQIRVLSSPSLRKLARELGVNLARVTPTGPRGRLVREDVESFVRTELSKPALALARPPGVFAGMLPWPKVDFARFGTVDRRPLSRLRKISGANLARNWVMIPHVTNFDEVDITELEAFRVQVNRDQKADEPKITMLAFLIVASIEALKRFPEYNASLDGEELVLKHYFHIGFAADTPNGLVVPVIRDADKKGIREIAREASELAALARTGKLKPEHMQGGCFTVSSLGGIGGTGFTPIINAPEAAILGVTRSELKPKWDGKQFQPRLILPLALSWDHRIVDGVSAARFLVTLASLLSDVRRMLL